MKLGRWTCTYPQSDLEWMIGSDRVKQLISNSSSFHKAWRIECMSQEMSIHYCSIDNTTTAHSLKYYCLSLSDGKTKWILSQWVNNSFKFIILPAGQRKKWYNNQGNLSPIQYCQIANQCALLGHLEQCGLLEGNKYVTSKTTNWLTSQSHTMYNIIIIGSHRLLQVCHLFYFIFSWCMYILLRVNGPKVFIVQWCYFYYRKM